MGNSRFKFRAWIDTEKRMMSHEEHISYGDTLSYEEVFEDNCEVIGNIYENKDLL